MLDDERNDFYIHIDKKVKDFDSSAFDGVLKHSNLTFCDRVNITWGDFSQIQSEMTLFKAAASANENYSYYHLISGVDLPIKSKDEIYRFLKKIILPSSFIFRLMSRLTNLTAELSITIFSEKREIWLIKRLLNARSAVKSCAALTDSKIKI